MIGIQKDFMTLPIETQFTPLLFYLILHFINITR